MMILHIAKLVFPLSFSGSYRIFQAMAWVHGPRWYLWNHLAGFAITVGLFISCASLETKVINLLIKDLRKRQGAG
jgi:hypothetical protein